MCSSCVLACYRTVIVEFCRPGSSPCGLGDGDCDDDGDCQGALVCGHDNCGRSGGLWDPSDDCCTRWGVGGHSPSLHQAVQPRDSLHPWRGEDRVKPPPSPPWSQGTCDTDADCVDGGTFHMCWTNCVQRTWYPIEEHPNNTEAMVGGGGATSPGAHHLGQVLLQEVYPRLPVRGGQSWMCQ